MNILILSGTHGNELSAVEVGLKLKNMYKGNDDITDNITDNITVIPFLNENGLINNTRECNDVISSDLNRAFKHSISYKNTIDYIKELVDQNDLIIDIHNSVRCSNFCLVDEGHNAQLIIDTLSYAGVEHAVRFSTGGTIKEYCNSIGKIGITYEFSGMSTLNTSAVSAKAFNDIIKIVRAFQNDLKIDSKKQQLESMYCLSTGFVNFVCDINHVAKPGALIFEIIDSNSEVIESVTNQYDYDIKLIALGHSFQTMGSQVLQYIRK